MTAAPRPRWHWLVLAATVFPAAGIVLGHLSDYLWIGELASHWTFHATLALLPAMVVFRRDARLGRVLLMLLVLGLLPWIQASWSSRAIVNGTAIAKATVATANVQFYHTDRSKMQAAIAALDCDLISLVEVTEGDEAALRTNPNWPHQVWSGENDFRKVALLSRQRIVTQRFHQFDGGTVLEALVDLGESALRVFVIHPIAPVSPPLTARRNRQLAMLAQELSLEKHPEPVLVLGDFNLSPGSPMWRNFLGYTKLLRAPGTAPATWPSMLGPCGIAIDHVLVRGGALAPLTAFHIPGSDHRGLLTTVSVPAQ
jgi:vancomycin resistance protein VanJ